MRPPAKAYIFSVLLTAAAVFIKKIGGIGDLAPFAGMSIPVIIISAYFGVWAGLFSSFISILCSIVFIMPRHQAFDVQQFIRLSLVMFEYVSISILVGGLGQLRIIRRSEEKFRVIADTVPSMFWQTDQWGNLVYESRAFLLFFGRVLGNGWRDVVHPDDHNQVDALNRQFSQPHPFESHLRLLNKDNEYRYCIIYGVPRFDDQQNFIGHIGKTVDVTLMQQAKLYLEEANSIKGAILECALDAIIVVDENGIVQEWNKAAEDIFLYKRQDAIGKNMAELIIPHGMREKQRQSLERIKQGGTPSLFGRRVELEGQKSDGTVFPVELVVCKLLTNGSIRYAGFVRDITARLFHEHELKTRKEAAEAALHMKEAFFNAISHDLRTPLNAIALNAQVIQMKKNHCDEEILEAADSSRENAHGAATMLNGFLEFARASQDKNKISSIDLDSILRKIHSSYQSKVALKKLHFDIPTMTGIVINTDESKLVKIIENLVDNAVKFTFAGGIVVQVAKEDKSIRISIADTGIGISDKNAYLLFNEFFQVNNYERDRAKGVGLGLAIARTLAEQIGGNIKLAYTNDAGSRFDVIIRGESPYASIDSGGRQVCSPSNENTNAR